MPLGETFECLPAKPSNALRRLPAIVARARRLVPDSCRASVDAPRAPVDALPPIVLVRRQARSKETRDAILTGDTAATEMAAQSAANEARHARTLDLAQETVRSLQQQLRRKDDEVAKYQTMLSEARDALRNEKATAAARYSSPGSNGYGGTCRMCPPLGRRPDMTAGRCRGCTSRLVGHGPPRWARARLIHASPPWQLGTTDGRYFTVT